jgi:hypothetical protein
VVGISLASLDPGTAGTAPGGHAAQPPHGRRADAAGGYWDGHFGGGDLGDGYLRGGDLGDPGDPGGGGGGDWGIGDGWGLGGWGGGCGDAPGVLGLRMLLGACRRLAVDDTAGEGDLAEADTAGGPDGRDRPLGLILGLLSSCFAGQRWAFTQLLMKGRSGGHAENTGGSRHGENTDGGRRDTEGGGKGEDGDSSSGGGHSKPCACGTPPAGLAPPCTPSSLTPPTTPSSSPVGLCAAPCRTHPLAAPPPAPHAPSAPLPSAATRSSSIGAHPSAPAAPVSSLSDSASAVATPALAGPLRATMGPVGTLLYTAPVVAIGALCCSAVVEVRSQRGGCVCLGRVGPKGEGRGVQGAEGTRGRGWSRVVGARLLCR